MMWSCFKSSSLLDNSSRIRAEYPRDESVSFTLKETMVRIVHLGGRVELYKKAIPASKLIQRNPGMCVTRPNVFKRPHEALLLADDMLLPGNKYFVIRLSTVEKLILRHSRKWRINESEESEEESGDFVVARDNWSILRKHVNEKRQFVPPIQRPRMWRDEWEPSLTSIQEVSP